MTKEQNSNELYQQVPEDFPHHPNMEAIPSGGIRLSMVKYENKFYTTGVHLLSAINDCSHARTWHNK
jgi:hypothetical protein